MTDIKSFLERLFFRNAWIVLVIYSLLMGYLSLRYFQDVPPEEKPLYEAHGAFYLHVLVYACYGILVCLTGHKNLKLTGWLMLGVLLYSGVLELLQSLTGYREASWADFIANGLGLLAGWLLYLFARRFFITTA